MRAGGSSSSSPSTRLRVPVDRWCWWTPETPVNAVVAARNWSPKPSMSGSIGVLSAAWCSTAITTVPESFSRAGSVLQPPSWARWLSKLASFRGRVLHRLTGPSLSEALRLTDKCLMGGLHERGPLTQGGEREIEQEMRDAVGQTHG